VVKNLENQEVESLESQEVESLESLEKLKDQNADIKQVLQLS